MNVSFTTVGCDDTMLITISMSLLRKAGVGVGGETEGK